MLTYLFVFKVFTKHPLLPLNEYCEADEASRIAYVNSLVNSTTYNSTSKWVFDLFIYLCAAKLSITECIDKNLYSVFIFILLNIFN